MSKGLFINVINSFLVTFSLTCITGYPFILRSDISYFVNYFLNYFALVYIKFSSNNNYYNVQIFFVEGKLVPMFFILFYTDIIDIIFNKYRETIGITLSSFYSIIFYYSNFVNTIFNLFLSASSSNLGKFVKLVRYSSRRYNYVYLTQKR